MTNPSGDEELGSAITDPSLATLFSELQAVANQPAPAIGEELRAVLSGTTPLTVSARRTTGRRLALVALASTGALAAGIGAATATDRLPASLQRAVAKVVNGVTPFELPAEPVVPDGADRPTPTPVGDDLTSNRARSGSDDDDASGQGDDGEDDRVAGGGEDHADDSDDGDGSDFDDDSTSEGDSDSDESDGGNDDGGEDGGDSDDEGGDEGDGDGDDSGDSEDSNDSSDDGESED